MHAFPKSLINSSKNGTEKNFASQWLSICPNNMISFKFYVQTKAGHFWKFCSRVLEINFGRDSRVSKIAFTEKIQHTLHDFQLPAYQYVWTRSSLHAIANHFVQTYHSKCGDSVYLKSNQMCCYRLSKLSIVGIITERYDMSIAHGNIDTQMTRKNHRKFIGRMSPLCWMALKRAGNPVGSSFLM